MTANTTTNRFILILACFALIVSNMDGYSNLTLQAKGAR